MEKSRPVNQNALRPKEQARLEEVQRTLAADPKLFARQGAVVASWRYYQGRKLGPYYRLAYREEGRQCFIYLGRDEGLAQAVRDLLAALKRPRRRRRLFDALRTQGRAMLRQAKASMAEELAKWGLRLKGFEVRGWREHKIPNRTSNLVARIYPQCHKDAFVLPTRALLI